MPKKYAISLIEDHLDLIEYLNGGVRPVITGDYQWFVFDMTPGNTDVENPSIEEEDDMYENGYLIDERVLLA